MSLQDYFIVRFETKRPKVFPDGRTVSIPHTSYYKSKGKDVLAPHLAAFLDEKLAEQIKQLYPEKNPTVSKESGYLTDNDPFYASLQEVGEAVSAQELESTIRAALRVLSKTEIQNILDKVAA
jgi:hypothetical protein